jgi:hypothetical protein
MSADVFDAAEPADDAVESGTLDRLVDGSLDPQARRDVLEALDRQADGWRRCALAFLEAQAWREAMTGLGDELRTETPHPAVFPVVSHPHPRPALGTLAMFSRAAVLLLAFTLGWLVARDGAHPRGPIVANRAEQPASAQPAPLSDATARPEPAAKTPGPGVASPAESRPSPRAALANLRTEVPADLPTEDFSASVLKQLARRGYQVEPASEIATVAIGQGRKLAVPVKGVRIRYVGNRTY